MRGFATEMVKDLSRRFQNAVISQRIYVEHSVQAGRLSRGCILRAERVQCIYQYAQTMYCRSELTALISFLLASRFCVRYATV